MNKWKRKPSDRVFDALMRMSRDRYLPPAEVIRITARLAACCSSGNGVERAVRERLYYMGCSATGLLRGQSPVPLESPKHRELSAVARDWGRDRLFDTELKLLDVLTFGVRKQRKRAGWPHAAARAASEGREFLNRSK